MAVMKRPTRKQSRAVTRTVLKIKRQPSEARRLDMAAREFHETADATVPGSSYWGYVERIARRFKVKPLDLSDEVESMYGDDDPDIVRGLNWRLSERDRSRPARRATNVRATNARAKKLATAARRDSAPRRSRTREEYLESIRYNQRDALEALQNAVGMRDWAAVKKYVAQLEKLDRREYDAMTAPRRIARVHEAMHQERYERSTADMRESRAEREARMRRVGWKFPGGRT